MSTIINSTDDDFSGERLCYFGTCSCCKRFNTSVGWCQSCDPQRVNQGPGSEVKELDDFLNEIQHKIDTYDRVIEWIPFDRLENLKEIGKGGLNTIYSATWIDGARTISVDYNKEAFVAKRLPNCTVTLKILNSNLNDFLHEV